MEILFKAHTDRYKTDFSFPRKKLAKSLFLSMSSFELEKFYQEELGNLFFHALDWPLDLSLPKTVIHCNIRCVENVSKKLSKDSFGF